MTVTIDQIATTLLRSSTPAEDSAEGKAWAMWIEDARRQIQRRLGTLSDLDQADLDYVVREAVALKSKRPDPVLAVSVAVDDGTVSKTYEKGSGQVLILDEWWDLLTPDEDQSGAWTINPVKRRC